MFGHIGRRSSLITNGVRINDLSEVVLRNLSYVDVSFDGGPLTYNKMRAGDYGGLMRGLELAKERGLRKINALHTLYSENVDRINDMVSIEEDFDFGVVAFSPFKVPHNHGGVSVSRSSLVGKVLPELSESRRFMESDKTKLLVSRLDLTVGEPEKFFQRVDELGLSEKVHYVDNPLEKGFVRVNYDGRVLTPHDAVHPALYGAKGYSLGDKRFEGLNEIFTQLQKDELG